MTTELATISTNHIQPVIDLVTNAVTSQHTKRAYGRALTEFMTWHQTTGQTGLNKATVQAHVSALRSEGATRTRYSAPNVSRSSGSITSVLGSRHAARCRSFGLIRTARSGSTDSSSRGATG